MEQKLNERAWAGQIISWIQEEIREKRSKFQDATNDAGIKLESGRTKFPDILLFTDKMSGIVFNGWELKFPDTPADNAEMLENALEKAKRLKSNSFVTWNGSEAIIWKINDEDYTIESLSKIKEYPKEKGISGRNDLSDPSKYRVFEPKLRSRLVQILHDLEQLRTSGELLEAINVSSNFIEAIKNASDLITPQFQREIFRLKGSNPHFREEFNSWKIYESSTLKILSTSSRREVSVVEEEVLAKFAFYNLIGKVIFYLTLSDNLSGSLEKLNITSSENLKAFLEEKFKAASRIDFQAVYKPYFTDLIDFSRIVDETMFRLLKSITEFDFKILPSEVIGTILENLVPKEEKQKFGQYFTPQTLALLVAFPAIKTDSALVFDPTSGTGTFLGASYQIFNYYGNTDHSSLLNQIWGNDISHFPAILSVINLYKQKIKNQTDNFPRVIRDDFFNLKPNMAIVFPDSNNYQNQIEQELPTFDAIVSNFPFIQQEDIPNEILTTFFKTKFENSQKAFLKDRTFKINERSDYFTYCIYNSIRFLKPEGYLSSITSNAWLGKDYGSQFKKFLLDNFHVKYVVKSEAEHWFSDSKVSTIYTVLQYGASKNPTKFITIKAKLNELFSSQDTPDQISKIEDFYSQINRCSDPKNPFWEKDSSFGDCYISKDKSVKVSIVEKEKLEKSLVTNENWDVFFISGDLFESFSSKLTNLYPLMIETYRGERTGWNPLFIIPASEVGNSGIEKEFLVPYVKSSTELKTYKFQKKVNSYLFVCDVPISQLKAKYKGAYKWVEKFKNVKNKNGSLTIPEACSGHRPFWYSLSPKNAVILTGINPFERLFFTLSDKPVTFDQRLAGIKVKKGYDAELIVAILNSVITYLTIEMKGTSRNLGALDLNANYFKTLNILNPSLLSEDSKHKIKNAFALLNEREVETVFREVKMADRRKFDTVVLKEFGINPNILDGLYDLLSDLVNERVSKQDN